MRHSELLFHQQAGNEQVRIAIALEMLMMIITIFTFFKNISTKKNAISKIIHSPETIESAGF